MLSVVPIMLALALPAAPAAPTAPAAPVDPSPETRLAAALKDGAVAWQFSGPEEVAAVLGAPQKDENKREGGDELLFRDYEGGLVVVFGREAGTTGPYALLGYMVGDRVVQPGENEPLRLRTGADVARLRPFTGLKNVDASRVDLRAEGARIRALPFDTLTRWPAPDKLPAGFDPAALLAAGRNPGLGLRALHARGVDGRGVDVAIIDQPLLANHVELEGRLHLVAQLGVEGREPSMHANAVASIAVGRTVGVAPRADLYYVAVATWNAESEGNHDFVEALKRLLELNRSGAAHIRVVSVSDGGFASRAQAAEWKAMVARAEREGVLLIVCDPDYTDLNFGLLRPLPGGDREKPEGYKVGTYGGPLLAPGDGRTYAGERGREDYAYEPRGGMSWVAPWLSGLAALGFQTNPALTPARVRAYLGRSATKMPYGLVVNPEGFLKLCASDPDRPDKP